MLEHQSNFHQRARRITGLQLVVFALIGAIVGAVIALIIPPGWPYILLGAAIGVAVATWLIRGSAKAVLGPLKTFPLLEDEAPRLWNLIDGLCLSNGIPEPDIQVIETDSVNSLVVGRDPNSSTLVVTRGMLQRLSRVELEAVLARQLVQIKTGETALGTVSIPLLQLAAALRIHGWLAPRLLQDQFDIMADLEGVSLTRYPPALAQALTKVATSAEVSNVALASGHLWLGCPFGAGSPYVAFSPIEHRIDVLQEL